MFALSPFDHAERGTVFHATAGVRELQFRKQQRFGLSAVAVEFHNRGVTDRLENRGMGPCHTGPKSFPVKPRC